MLVLQSPKKKLGNLFKIIMNNQAAYEKAVTAVQRTLDPRLKDFPTEEYLSFSLKEDAVLTPVLICPACELIDTSQDSGNAYIGLFVNAVYQIMKKPQNIRGTLLPALKALSDGSKFDILLSLMTSPKYNLELAEALNLTAATVSHHMNVLLTYPLVSVEKKRGAGILYPFKRYHRKGGLWLPLQSDRHKRSVCRLHMDNFQTLIFFQDIQAFP